MRELENVIQRALALTTSAEIGVDALPTRVAQGAGPDPVSPSNGAALGPVAGRLSDTAHRGQGGDASWSDEQVYRKAREIAVTDFERRYFARLLRRTEGNLSEAARLAGLDRSNLRRALARLGMRPENWRGSSPR